MPKTVISIGYLLLPILYIFVPQAEHVPVVAGLPFFIVTCVGLFMDFLPLHFTQYASIRFTSSSPDSTDVNA
jgi:hypothetical protein